MTKNNARRTSLVLEVARLVLIAALLAFTYNSFSSKGLPLIPAEVRKEAVSDSALFDGTGNAGGGADTSHVSTPDAPRTVRPEDIKVISPLHDRAIRNPDSMKAVVEAEKKKPTVYRIISLAQFKRLRSQRRGILFDARTADDYGISRIPGAKNIPGQDAENHFADVAELPRDTLVLIYCNNPDCHLGRMLAEFLGALEFRNLLLYDDGWDGWLAAKEVVDTLRVKQ